MQCITNQFNVRSIAGGTIVFHSKLVRQHDVAPSQKCASNKKVR